MREKIRELADKFVEDVLKVIEEEKDSEPEVIKMIHNPARTYAICYLGIMARDSIEVNLGESTLEFKRYEGRVRLVRDVHSNVSLVELDDGTSVDEGWVIDAAQVLSVIYSEPFKSVYKGLLSNVYYCGKDKPVGFYYLDYMVVVAPMIRCEE